MADFITQLAERALGAAPVVQPQILSMFAPEPSSYPMGLAGDDEASVSSGNLNRDPIHPAMEVPPVWDVPKEMPKDTAVAQRKEQGAIAPITPPTPSGTSDVSPEPRQPAGAHPSERTIVSGREDRRSLFSVMPGAPQRTAESRPDTSHLSESGSSEREAIPGKYQQNRFRATTMRPQAPPGARPETPHHAAPGPTPRALPEDLYLGPPIAGDESGQVESRTIRTLVDTGQGAAPTPVPASPGPETSLAASESMPEVKATSDHPAPPAAAPGVTPRMVRPLLDDHPDRRPRELRATESEPSTPTIRVAIGRIEVRAITPPPRPLVQQMAPARPAPTLSLDDYLKQRNGEQR
jgi:hypothetical protein